VHDAPTSFGPVSYSIARRGAAIVVAVTTPSQLADVGLEVDAVVTAA